MPRPNKVKNLRERCEAALSSAVTFARLFDAGILGVRGSQFAAIQIAEGLGLGQKNRSAATEIGRWCQAEIAAQYVLISGEALAQEVKSPSQPLVYPLGKEEWKQWAAAFRTVADTIPEGAEWGLKGDAEEAHGRMIELFPELFSETS